MNFYHYASKIAMATSMNQNEFDFDLDDLYVKLMAFDVTSKIIFPQKLHNLLQQNDHPEIISWLPDGQSFKIHDKIVFENFTLTTHFDGIKFRSFQRQLNFYGFGRLDNRMKNYSYKHKRFTRGNTSNLGNLKKSRTKSKV